MQNENIATMNSAELEQYIEFLVDRHRRQLKTLKALQRAREAEESLASGARAGRGPGMGAMRWHA